MPNERAGWGMNLAPFQALSSDREGSEQPRICRLVLWSGVISRDFIRRELVMVYGSAVSSLVAKCGHGGKRGGVGVLPAAAADGLELDWAGYRLRKRLVQSGPPSKVRVARPESAKACRTSSTAR